MNNLLNWIKKSGRVYIPVALFACLVFFKFTATASYALVELDYFGGVAQGSSIILGWDTVSEIGTAGFNIWRCKNGVGGYVRINPVLIEAEGSPVDTLGYFITDDTVEPGATYYYLLEDIDNFGLSTFHGPIQVSIQAFAPLPAVPTPVEYLPPLWFSPFPFPYIW